MKRSLCVAAWALGALGTVGCYDSHGDRTGTPDAGTTQDASPPDLSSLDAAWDASLSIDGAIDLASSDLGLTCDAPRWATSLVAHAFGSGQSFNQERGFPQVLFGPPEADTPASVVSLGNGGFVVLGFERRIVDGPGPDFIVFENPLPGFIELATVAVSDDGVTWFEFPCDAAQDAADYGFCAGVSRVYSHPNNGIDPFDPNVAGGDAFDLADLGLQQARYVRITDRADLDGPRGVFDLDAVTLVHSDCGSSAP